MVTSPSPASVASPSPLGAALARAVAQLRTALHDPLAPITVIVPAGPNGVLARRALATQGPILRVWFETPDGLLNAQLPASSWKTLRPEPAGWLRVTLADCVQTLSAHGQLGPATPLRHSRRLQPTPSASKPESAQAALKVPSLSATVSCRSRTSVPHQLAQG